MERVMEGKLKMAEGEVEEEVVVEERNVVE